MAGDLLPGEVVEACLVVMLLPVLDRCTGSFRSGKQVQVQTVFPETDYFYATGCSSEFRSRDLNAIK